MHFLNLLSAVTAYTLIAFTIAAPIQTDTTSDAAVMVYAKSCGPEPVGTIAAREEKEVFATCGH
ncbi:hypothetical protein CC80DRAFT_488546 [Byssothecium circinans]|uniref:Uncharacterized protein n=1 Tax=Byssothecium circinans TaxID=147558 RepID=A0A6A5UJH1_9PLEO|nr:hypothetical protein CC80DRAFT_488546 [Byssothecium circinans]